jgi:hypothetical protein
MEDNIKIDLKLIWCEYVGWINLDEDSQHYQVFVSFQIL